MNKCPMTPDELRGLEDRLSLMPFYHLSKGKTLLELADWLENPQPQWIPVDDPPQERCECVVRTVVRDFLAIPPAVVKRTVCAKFDDGEFLVFGRVTHWMPLPPDPQEAESD